MIVILLAIIAATLLFGTHIALIAFAVLVPLFIIWKLVLWWVIAKAKIKDAAGAIAVHVDHEFSFAPPNPEPPCPYWMQPRFEFLQTLGFAIGFGILIKLAMWAGL